MFKGQHHKNTKYGQINTLGGIFSLTLESMDVL